MTPKGIHDRLRTMFPDADIPAVGTLIPAQRTFSRPLRHLVKVPVRLLVETPQSPVSGALAKTQPQPLKPGMTVYASLRPDGLVALYPFVMAGTGYELITDAIEGQHFEFE